MNNNSRVEVCKNAAAPSTGSLSLEKNSHDTAPALSQEIEKYLHRKRAKGLKEGSIEQYSIVLNALLNYTTKDLPDITDWDIIEFLDDYELSRGVSKRRKENMRVILNGFFRYETDKGNINSNPMVSIDSIKYKKNTRMPLTDIEFELLREACISLRDKALLEFFFATGCRVSEVERLNITDIDFNNRSLKVLGKGDKERIVFLNASSIVALNNYLENRKGNSEALFISERSPYQRIKKATIEKCIRSIGERSKVERKVYPHLIRHTTATYLLNHGMKLEEVQMVLGHDSMDTTRIYAKSDIGLLQGSYRRCMSV